MMGLPANAGPQTTSSASGRNTQVASHTTAANGFAEKTGFTHEADFTESLAESEQQISTNQSKAQLESLAPDTTGVNGQVESTALGSLGEAPLNAELSPDANADSNDELNVGLGEGLVEGVSADVSTDLSALAKADVLGEPATQLWHWHYSRGVGSEQIGSTAFGKMAAMADAMAGVISGKAGEMPTANTQAAASQTAAVHTVSGPVISGPMVSGNVASGPVVSGHVESVAESTAHAEGARLQATSAAASLARSDAAAERRFGFSASFSESGLAPITLLAANKVLQQQLASGSISAATVNLEEASNSLTTSGAQLTSTQGRAGVPIHEWAPVAVDSTNKAQLGAQLLHTLKEKVELQLNQEVQQARIKLDPPEMGRLELSIRLEGDKLHIHIAASQGAVRDALSAHADRLRHDLLPHHSGGVEVSVGQEGQPQKSPFPHLDNAILMAESGSAELEHQQQAGAGWINALV